MFAPRLILAGLRREAGRRGWLAPPGAAPVAPPLERLAADLRRLHLKLRALSASAPPYKAHRMRAIRLAYDDRLADACQALGVAHALRSLGGDLLALERLRVEEELARRGLEVRPPR